MRRTLISGAMCALLLPAVPAPVAAQPGPLRGLDGYVEQAMRDWEVPGLALAVVRGDSVIYARGYGVRELGRAEQVDEHTLFAVASTTKAFTAAALGMLVDEGRLRWEDRATQHLRGFQLHDPYVTRELTVRDLLSHRSGLARGDRLWWGTPFTREEVLYLVRFLEPAWSFRSRYGYQNIMFLAAGEILPAVTGVGWDDFLGDRIFVPLGMTRTSTSVRALEGERNTAVPHMLVDERVRTIPWRSYDNLGGAGSINSSAMDMAQWIRLNLNGGSYGGRRILSDSVIREMQTPQTLIPSDTATARLYPETHFRAYGLGWTLQDYRGEKLVSHGGSLDGMRTQVAMIPARGIGVVVISNLDGTNLQTAISYRVLDALLGRTPPRDWSLDLRTARDRGREQAEKRRRELEAQRVADTRPSLPLAAYAGVYADSMYGEVRVRDEGGRLFADFAGAFGGELEHWHFDTFRAAWTDPQAGRSFMTFAIGRDGKVAGVEVEGIATFGVRR